MRGKVYMMTAAGTVMGFHDLKTAATVKRGEIKMEGLKSSKVFNHYPTVAEKSEYMASVELVEKVWKEKCMAMRDARIIPNYNSPHIPYTTYEYGVYSKDEPQDEAAVETLATASEE